MNLKFLIKYSLDKLLKSKVNQQRLVFLLNFYPALLGLGYLVIMLETYVYRGYFKKFIYFDSVEMGTAILVIFYILLIFSQKYLKKWSLNKFHLVTFYLSLFIAPAILIFENYLLTLESNNFINYVFSHFHLHLAQIRFLLIYNLTLIAIYYFFRSEKIFFTILTKKNQCINILLGVVVSLMIFRTNQSLIDRIQIPMRHLEILWQNPNLTYEKKMTMIIKEYPYIMFIKSHTPTDAVIAIPPQQTPWLTMGNAGYIRYFLYPRTLTQTDSIYNASPEANYVIIAKGGWNDTEERYGWPKAPIAADQIWYFDRETNQTSLSDQKVFDLNKDPTLKYRWGLIKVKTTQSL